MPDIVVKRPMEYTRIHYHVFHEILISTTTGPPFYIRDGNEKMASVYGLASNGSVKLSWSQKKKKKLGEKPKLLSFLNTV